MTLSFKFFLDQVVTTIRTPRDGARWVKSISLPRQSQWEALALFMVVGVVFNQIAGFLMFGDFRILMMGLVLNPITYAMIQMAVLVIMVFAIFWIGRSMGGTGGFGDTILLVAWLQAIMTLLQVVQTIAILLIPPLGIVIALASFALFFWLLSNFIAELHGFTSIPKVLGMILISMIGLTFGITILLSIIGVSMPGGV
jgi:hypothetical protein